MCGIAGYIVTQPEKVRGPALQKLARELLLSIESRGTDASGYAFVSAKDRFVHLVKLPVRASEFVKLGGDNLLSRKVKHMPRAMILHTRFATQGKPSENMNNHPVYSKTSGLCMVHNGWLANDAEVVQEYEIQKDAEVDTETYLRLIEKFYLDAGDKQVGVEDGIKQATEAIWGSVACAMIQAGRLGVVWLWRESGPVALAQVDWGWVFASEQRSIMHAIYMSGIHAIDVSFANIGDLSAETLVRFNADGTLTEHKLGKRNWDDIPTPFEHRVTKVWNQSTNGYVYKRNRASTQTTGYFGGYGDSEDAEVIPNASSYQRSARGPIVTSSFGLDDKRTRASNEGTQTGANSSRNEAKSEGDTRYERHVQTQEKPHYIECVCRACTRALRAAAQAAKI